MVFIMEGTSLAAGVESANSFGQMERHTRESGVQVKKTGMGFGNLQKETITKANGCKIYKTERDVTVIRVAQCIEVTSKIH